MLSLYKHEQRFFSQHLIFSRFIWFVFQESKNALAIVCIVVMLTYIIGFAVGLGKLHYVVA